MLDLFLNDKFERLLDLLAERMGKESYSHYVEDKYEDGKKVYHKEKKTENGKVVLDVENKLGSTSKEICGDKCECKKDAAVKPKCCNKKEDDVEFELEVGNDNEFNETVFNKFSDEFERIYKENKALAKEVEALKAELAKKHETTEEECTPASILKSAQELLEKANNLLNNNKETE